MPLSLSDKMQNFRTLIFNSKDPEIATKLEEVGVDADYLTAGETLHNETEQLIEKQKQEYQESATAYDNFYLAKDEAKTKFKKTFKVVDVTSRKDQNLRDRLKLTVAVPYAIEEWISYTTNFYNALLNESDFLTKISKFKVTSERVNAEKSAIEALKPLRDAAKKEEGEAQEATRVRNAKLEELDDYCDELKVFAELALEDEPQLLEKLGIFVRS